MLMRREVLKFALGGLGSSVLLDRYASAAEPAPPVQAPAPQPRPTQPAPTQPGLTQPGLTLGPAVEFKDSTPVDYARELAKHPFKSMGGDLPDPFRSLSYEQYSAIKLKPGARLWGDGSLGFVLEPLHRGFQFSNAVRLNIVADGHSQPLVYSTDAFDFGALKPSAKTGDIGFSGFRLLSRRGQPAPTEVAIFQGANFYKAVADGQVQGLLSRALALKVADPKGEELPAFREIWITRPSAVADSLVLQAVIDSESVAGAFRFTIRPGPATIVDVECTLFARVNIDNYGLGPMSATHLLGFMDHRKFDDYRPNVAEVGGLQLLTGAGEWVWRPITNRDELQISTFVDTKPRGFGCLLRDRDFQNYLDGDEHWERRPSLWIEPLGDWGEGGVQLIEIPSQSDANDNVLCFWRPKAPLKGGAEMSFAYRQFWCWDPPERPDLARATRSYAGLAGRRTRFFVEFGGDILADERRTAGLTPTLTTNTGSITMLKTFPARDQKAFRVLFELDPQNAGACELRLVLEAAGARISETWLYRWTSA